MSRIAVVVAGVLLLRAHVAHPRSNPHLEPACFCPGLYSQSPNEPIHPQAHNITCMCTWLWNRAITVAGWVAIEDTATGMLTGRS